MRDWFEALETREQVFVFAGGVVVLCTLLYFLAWAPLDKKHTDLAADVALWEHSLAELKPLSARVKSGEQPQAQTTEDTTQSPIIIVDQTLQNRRLDSNLKRSQPTTSSGIRVEFENVSFDELILWLGDLSDQYGMHVQAASFARGSRSSAGRVNATLTLERGL